MKENICKSTLAGILIGLGVIANLQSGNPILGALLFSFGLLTIINMQLNLYTGKIGFLNTSGDIPSLIVTFLGNCLGVAIVIFAYLIANPGFEDIILAASAVKFSKSIPTLFINACFCGMLIHFAVKNKTTVITIFAIMIFILIGAEHCIADYAYYICAFSPLNSPLNLVKFISIIFGNSIGALIIERLSD